MEFGSVVARRFRVRLDAELRPLVHGVRCHVRRRWRRLLSTSSASVSETEILSPAAATAAGVNRH